MTNEAKHDLRAFATGAIGYSLIELMARGKTHWTMSLTGGMCFMLMHKVIRRKRERKLLHKCMISSAIITSFEYVVGLIANKLMKWDVWDYSDRKLHLHGQICPRFSLYWFLMGIPITMLSNRLSRRLG